MNLRSHGRETRHGAPQELPRLHVVLSLHPSENCNGLLHPPSLHDRSSCSLYTRQRAFFQSSCKLRSVAKYVGTLYVCFSSSAQASEGLMPHFSSGKHFLYAFAVGFIPLTLSGLLGTCIIYNIPACLQGGGDTEDLKGYPTLPLSPCKTF